MEKKDDKMPISVHIKNFPSTQTLMDYIHKRLESLNKFSDMAMHLEVHLEEERGLYKGVGVLKMKGRTVRVEATNKDPMAVIDEMKDILSREIKKIKDKTSKERRRQS